MNLEKKDIERLAGLARIELTDEEKENILSDLKGIFGYVENLRTVNTEGVEPMAGGTIYVNECRADDERVLVPTPAEDFVRVFPEVKDGYLKVPYVFE